MEVTLIVESALSPNEILAAGASAAAAVTFGGLYALFLALGRLRRRRTLLHALACMSYLLLAISLLVVSRALRFDTFWNVVLLVLLVAYLVSPPLIWRLTAATHEREQPPAPAAEEYP